MNLLANTWWTWLFGNDSKVEGTPVLQWANMPESWGVFVLILIIAAIAFGVFWLYRREMNVCPKPIKLLLAGLRLTVLLFLVALFLKPSVFFQQVNEIKPSIPFLRDSSLSVARADQYRDAEWVDRLANATGLNADRIRSGDVNRAELLNAAMQRSSDAIAAIREKGAIQVIDFADGTRNVAILPSVGKNDVAAPKPEDEQAVETDGGPNLTDTVPTLIANGLGTDIRQALRDTLEKAEKLSAIVLFSDFQHNGTENPVELAQKAAALDIPIYVVGVGDPNPPRNIQVSEVYVRNKAYPNEPFEIEGLLQVNNLAGAASQLNVELQQQRIDSRTGKPGPVEKVKVMSVNVPDRGGRIRVDFEHVLELPGKYVFSLSTEALEDETNLADNRKSSPEMEVVDEKVRVLLIAGLPSWDYQQVQRLLQRDQNISLSCFLQSMDETRPQEGNEPITRLPETMDELREYNVVIMMDPNPNSPVFDRNWTAMLKEFCQERAGGVLFMAGPQFTSEFLTLNKLSGMRDLLPVRFGDVEFIDTTQILAKASSNEALEMKVVDYNLDHPVMSFRANAMENKQIWDSLPGVFWSFPTKSAKPTARVLLENSAQISADGNQPLMVAGRYGAGSVLYMGFQGTWRWRRVGLQAQYFDRFWVQVIRYLVETRSLQGSRRGFIDSDKSEYELGDRVSLVARILDPQFQPSNQPTFDAQVKSDDGRTQTVKLKLLPQQSGRYEGSFIAQRTGNYEATIDFQQDEEGESLADPVAFRMVTPSAESGAYWLNEKLMTEIAEQSGGRVFQLDQLDELAETIPKVSERITFRSPPRPLWDMNLLLRLLAFCLPVLLLCTEWAIRKWYKLL